MTLDWWPAEGTELDAYWTRRTMIVIDRIWARHGATLYWRRGTEQLREDLRSWLVDQAMRFRTRFVMEPPRDSYDEEDGPELSVWLRCLHGYLATAAPHHFSTANRMGPIAPAEAYRIVYSTRSLDEPLTGEGETLGNAAAYTGGVRALWCSAEPVDPLDHIIRCEDLTDQIDRAEGRDPARRRLRSILTYEAALERLDQLVPSPAPTQCVEFDCPGRVRAQHRCDRHYMEWLDAKDDRPRCTEPGADGTPCDRPIKGRGLCEMHYMRARRAGHLPPVEQAVCVEPGCGQPCGPSGRCPRHYKQAWRRQRRLARRTA